MLRFALLLLLFATPTLADVCPTYEAVPHRMIVAPHAGADVSHAAIHRFASGAMLIETDQSAEALMATGRYRYAEPDYIVSIDAVPNEFYYDPNFMYGLFRIDAAHAWDLTTGDPNVVVEVIDTGSGPHPDLDGNLIPGYDYLNEDADPSDDNRHGTHTAGTIGAVGNNLIDTVGVAWRVSIAPCKFLSGCGSGNTSDAIQCIDWGVAHGVDIMSNSWGGGGFSQALLDSINGACAAGVLFVASAGNNAANSDVTPQYPGSYDAPCIISVAATDSLDLLASYSNFGTGPQAPDLAAPGSNVLSLLPYPYTCGGPTAGARGYLSGTSMACPHVAGVAALVKSLHPTWTYPEIKAAILGGADVLPSLTGKTVTGGRLNAAGAVGAVVPPDPPSAFCGDGTCQTVENCKQCESDCVRVRKPRQSRTCCGDGRIDPGDLTRCGGDN